MKRAYYSVVREQQKEQNDRLVWQYIQWKLVHRKYKRRPLELRYLFIAKFTGLSYQQVRTSVNRFVATGKLQKFQQYFRALNGSYTQKNYYRLVEVTEK